MFLLVTGASGVGKSTIRPFLEAEFRGILKAAELFEIAGPPEWTIQWRQKAVEKAVKLAVTLQLEGKHFLLCGDPVPQGEVYAAPSFNQIDGIAICLLDASPECQRNRLLTRGDDPKLIPHHIAFAKWMREDIIDPDHQSDVIMEGGWEEMRWERWNEIVRSQSTIDSQIIDTTNRTPREVGELVMDWIHRSLYAR